MAPAARPALQLDISDLGDDSMSLSADGRYLAYARAYYASGGREGALPMEMHILDLKTRASVKVGETLFWGYPQPQSTWSPDGRYLAYIGMISGDMQPRLRVWDRTVGKEVFASAHSVPPDALRPVWTRDGRTLIYKVDERLVDGRWAAQTQIGGIARQKLFNELYGKERSPGGVRVLLSPSVATEEVDELPGYAEGYQGVSARWMDSVARSWPHLIVLDLETWRESELASGAPVAAVHEGETPGSLLVLAQETLGIPEARFSGTYALYRIALSDRANGAFAENAKGVKLGSRVALKAADGKELTPLAGGLEMVVDAASFSPSGRYLGFTDPRRQKGPGDLWMLDTRDGQRRNLTATRTFPPNPLDTSADRNSALPHGKFGSAQVAPVWLEDEQAMLVLHVAGVEDGDPKMQLWRVAVDGTSSRVGMPANVSIEGLADCNGASSCLIGSKKEVFAKIRFVDSGAFALAAVDPASGAVRIIRTPKLSPAAEKAHNASPVNVEDTATSRTIVAARDGTVVYRRPSTEDPPELWILNLDRARTAAASLDVINPGPSPQPTRRERLSYVNPDGETVHFYLSLPAGARKDGSLPIVISAYPDSSGTDWTKNAALFDGGPSRNPELELLRIKGGYAVADLMAPHKWKEKQGHRCEFFTRNVEAALDAVIASGWVDGNKAGLHGFSWGGYLANCVATRSNRFKAVASGSGRANLASAYNGIWHEEQPALGPILMRQFTGGAPWEVPQAYVEESPIYHLDKVQTPMLFYYGKYETGIFAEDMLEMFYGLQSLGKPAVLLAYDDAAHGQMYYRPDFTNRLIGWFDTYLQPEKRMKRSSDGALVPIGLFSQ